MRVGDRISFRPRSVARTRLIGLREPLALASTSLTPTASSTARIAPPAITPVPSDAGCMYTCAAPWPDLTACHRVPLLSSTLDMPLRRSEEHTSELQSLMRISYAVFCLKKKTTNTTKHIHNLQVTTYLNTAP